METLTGVRYIIPEKDPRKQIKAAMYVLGTISGILNKSLRKSQFGIQFDKAVGHSL